MTISTKFITAYYVKNGIVWVDPTKSSVLLLFCFDLEKSNRLTKLPSRK